MSQPTPVFGLSKQRELIYQVEIDLLKQKTSEIVVVLDDIEAEIGLINPQIPDIIADLAWLNTNAVTSLTVASTYDSLSCPGEPTVDLFDAVSTTLLTPGVSATINARPLTSTNNSVYVTYNVGCGFIDLQVPDPVTLTSTGLESLVSDGIGPDLVLKSLVAGTDITLSAGLTDVSIDYTGLSLIVTSAGAGLSLVTDGAGPDMSIKGLAAADATTSVSGSGTEVTLAATGSNITLATTGAGVSLVSTESGANLGLYGLTAGSNISVTSTAGPAVTIQDTQTNKTYGMVYTGGVVFSFTYTADLTWTPLVLGSAYTAYTTKSADVQVFNTNCLRYTGSTTKVVAVYALFQFSREIATSYTIYSALMLNGLTILPASVTKSNAGPTGWNCMLSGTTLSMATNDYVQIVTQSEIAGASPYPVAFNFIHINISIYEI